MKKIVTLIGIMLSTLLLGACNTDAQTIILSTTTSTDNSGLLDYLLPYFEEESGIEVKVVAVGTGAALKMGELGEADILIVHDEKREFAFMEDNYGVKRSDLMFNDFVFVGPKEIGDDTLASVLSTIKMSEATFLSRGDQSGTHSMELRLWSTNEIETNGNWYIESGQGMGSTLSMASEQEAYTLSDRSTYYSMQDNLELMIVYQNKEELKNQYGVILVNPELHKNVNAKDASVFYEWLISERGQELINTFGVEEYGDNLFVANAIKE